MAGAFQLILAQVMHARARPKPHRFRYRVPYVALPAEALEGGRRRFGLFSIDGGNLFSLRTRDYGDGASPPVAFVKSALEEQGLRAGELEIVLVTIPRLFGMGFNPVSFWLCLDVSGNLRAVVAEVNNTFGERHFYLCCHDDHRPIAAGEELSCRKVFHVSPFLKLLGDYKFRFSWTGKTLAVRIDLHDDCGAILRTSLAGECTEMTSRRLAATFLLNPLLMVKVIALIHFEAVRLFLKGVAHLRKPAPPAELVSR